MTFETLTATSFRTTDKNGNDEIVSVYRLPKQLTNWQIMAIAELMGDFVCNCSEAGTTILNIGMAVANAQEGEGDAIQEALGQLQDLFSGGFTGEFTKGIGEVLRYLGKQAILSHVSAILFLKDGEQKLTDDAVAARTEIFNGLPANVVWDGIRDFFLSRGKSSTNSLSPLPTSETTTSSSTPSTSETSTGTSTGASGTSTPLLTDDLPTGHA